jgi:cell surface protein SprA
VGMLVFDEHGRPDINVNYSLFDALRGNGPSMGFRLGLAHHLPLYMRVFDDAVQVRDMLSTDHRIQARTAINPSRTLQINLNWNTDWGLREDVTYRNVGHAIHGTATETGQNRSSVWSFGASYLDFFQRQYETYVSDYDRSDGQTIGDNDGDGRVVLTNQSVVEDFRKAFLMGGGTLDRQGFQPFPMPGWTVNYSGISKWPIIRSMVQTATLRHGYRADYATDFRTNTAAAMGDTTLSLNLGGQTIVSRRPLYEAGAVRVNEVYSPLIGVDLGLKGNVQTALSWNRSNTYSLSTSNFDVSEMQTNELVLTVSFTKQGMSLPFLPGKRLNNRVSFSLSGGYSESSDQRYSLRTTMTEAARDKASGNPVFVPEDALGADFVTVLTGSNRLTLAPKLAYQFSNRVSADFTLRYEKFDSANSRQANFTSLTGNFNVRVSISN